MNNTRASNSHNPIIKEMGTAERKDQVLAAAALLLSTHPYDSVSLEDIASAAILDIEEVKKSFASMHSVGSEILALEGTSMRESQKRVAAQTPEPLQALRLTFQLVGQNLATNIVVRAGVRIAAESAHRFPERQIDPYRTWEDFVLSHLEMAKAAGSIRNGVDTRSLTRLFVAAAMGTKDLVAFKNAWTSAAERLDETAKSLIALITKEPS